MKNRRRALSCVLGVAFALSLVACGGDSPPPTVSPTPTPSPGAAVTASGNGNIVIHPSAAAAWFFALEMPVRLQETGGGTADWNYARLTMLTGGVPTEVAEIGSDILIQGGAGRVAARSDEGYTLVFRTNSSDFDDIQLDLGFSDVNRGNQFTAAVPFDTFSDVALSLTPLAVPREGKVEIAGQ